MAIYGRRVTALAPYGAPGQPEGLLAGALVIPLLFPLQLAGGSTNRFEDAVTFLSCQEVNVGIQLVVQVLGTDGLPVNIRPATSLKIMLLKPDTISVLTKTATLLTNGMDGKLYYNTIAADDPDPADLNEAGLWRIQANFSLSGGFKSTRWGAFRVGLNIVEPAP